MRITILTFGSRGDIQPYIALGLGLKSAGHQVRLVTHGIYEPLINSYKLGFTPVAGNPEELLEGGSGTSWIKPGTNMLAFLRGFLEVSRPLFKQLLHDSWVACQGTDIILYSVFGWFAAYHIAEKSSVPAYPAYNVPVSPTRAFPNLFFPPNIRLGPLYNRFTYDLYEQMFWLFTRQATNLARKEVLDLPPLPLRSPMAQMHARRIPTLYGFSPSILPKPSDWGDWLQVTGQWFLDPPESWRPPDGLVRFLGSGEPPVYVGFGSMSTYDPEGTTQLVLQALKLAGQRGVLLTGWGGMDPERPPEGIFITKALPHTWLFPKMKTVVHHGGAGTTGAGLRAGVPNVIVPFIADQPFWGNRVHQSGVGPRPLDRKSLTVEKLAEAIHSAITDGIMQARAMELGKRIRDEDGVGRAVEVFEEWMAE